MSKKFNNKQFEEHISNLIVDKENFRYIQKQKMIMKKIVYVLAEENWVQAEYSNSQLKTCRDILVDYAWVYAVNELITILNDNGTLKEMSGVKKWADNYEENFLSAFLKTKELKANQENIADADNGEFITSFNRIINCKDEQSLVKKIITVGEKHGILQKDLLSERGYTLELEGRLLDKIWDEA